MDHQMHRRLSLNRLVVNPNYIPLDRLGDTDKSDQESLEETGAHQQEEAHLVDERDDDDEEDANDLDWVADPSVWTDNEDDDDKWMTIEPDFPCNDFGYFWDGEIPSHKKIEEINDLESAEPGRATWGGQLEFILTCVGYAVGLGNVWRFPYLCYKNGGGAFLFPYVIMLALVGLPLFYMELAFGQFASLGPITIWRLNPLFKGLGYGMVIVSWLIGLYYNVIIAHTIFYFFASMQSVLPWTTCGNDWNTEHCVHPNANHTNLTAMKNDSLSRTASEEYYNNYVLEQSSGMDELGLPSWKLLLCLLFAWLIVYAALIRGIASLGKVVYFTAIFPYLMLTVLLIRGVTLQGAGQGILYYLKPDFSKLSDSRVWSDAATQIFYSLSACTGGLIAMASYNKFDNNCYRDSLIVALINCGTSVYAGLVIFSILGFMAYEKNVDVADVARGGPGLAFVVYPEAISRMPIPQLWAVFFFLMMATLGFGSQFSIMECVLSAFQDELKPYFRNKYRDNIIFRTAVIFLSFLLGIPMICKGGIYLLNLVDYSVGGFPLLFIGFLECAAINWLYGFKRFAEDIKLMLGNKPNIYWKACWLVLTPVTVLVTIAFNCFQYKPPSLDDYTYPEWAKGLGWMIALFPLLLFPAWFLYQYCRDGGWMVLRESLKPMESWGPALMENRTDIYAAMMEQKAIDNGLDNDAYINSLATISTFNSRVNLNMIANKMSGRQSMKKLAVPQTNEGQTASTTGASTPGTCSSVSQVPSITASVSTISAPAADSKSETRV
ncbi:sodium- and chloride-dependent glycine transporter 1-like isoform X2 [Tubulanus polymorphus]|uniref:sodium- and chloride-dependent glycine transporter 1-like isoform X2 n=1 Tax=Tubulanus polymorphus TaxID=672921 RepID=UPI003DA611B9